MNHTRTKHESQQGVNCHFLSSFLSLDKSVGADNIVILWWTWDQLCENNIFKIFDSITVLLCRSAHQKTLDPYRAGSALDRETPKAELSHIIFLEQFSSRVPRCSWTCQTHPRAIHGACSPAKPSLGEGLKSPHYHFGCNSTYLQFFQAYVLFQIEPFTGNVTDIHVKPSNMLILCHMLFTRHLKLFRCVSISSNYPGEPVGWLVRHTFRFPLCWCQ